MIKIEKLTKVYKSKNNEQCVAINEISTTLEDTGLVFIIGKSGSGKTTLLGLLGGLDNITSGDIIINGNSLRTFKYNNFVDYRNQMVGYIFQDFHLIDEITVEENIAVSLDLQNIQYTDQIDKALESVGLGGYGKRYPKELSGGEKQRIAIARALVKNPRIILADEPTGNLDSKTTTQILDLLQELSKNRLVVVVSHSLGDANKYANRIIELSNGKIINDYIRNENYCYDYQIVDNELILPLNKKISEEDKIKINKELSNGNIKSITQTEDVFITNKKKYRDNYSKTALKSSKFNFKKLLKFTSVFIKKDFFKLFLYSFVVACLVVILGLAQLIVNFDQSEVIKAELQNMNQTSISFTRNVSSNEKILKIDDSRYIPITEEDIKLFSDSGYQGEIYPLLNITLDFGSGSSVSNTHRPATFNPNELYFGGTNGVLVTNEEYVKSLYGFEENIQYVALADSQEDFGIYITDYTADGLLKYNKNIFKSF